MRALLACLVLLVLGLPARADEQWLYDKQLSASIPKELYNLTPKAIEENYKPGNRPQHVFRNQLGDYSVAFNHLTKKVSPAELPSLQTNLKEDLLHKLEGVQWLGSKARKIHGVGWFELEFKSLENGFLLHTWVLGTSWKGRLLEVTISAFDDVDPQLSTHVDEIISSLTFTPAK